MSLESISSINQQKLITPDQQGYNNVKTHTALLPKKLITSLTFSNLLIT